MKTKTLFARLPNTFYWQAIKFGPYFSLVRKTNRMNTERDQNKNEEQQVNKNNTSEPKQRSSAFKETSRGDEKSTTNIEEEADLEQQRKEALTERD